MAVPAYPHTGVPVGTAEVFAELMSLDVGASGDHSSIAIEADHHVAHIDRIIPKLSALASRNGVLLGSDGAEGRDGDIVVRKRLLGEIGVAVQAGFSRLPF